jgi:hypothetical protein
MISVGDRANILITDREIGIMTRHLLRLLQNGSLPTRVEFGASLLILQYMQLFGWETENGAPSAAKIFVIQASSEEFP